MTPNLKPLVWLPAAPDVDVATRTTRTAAAATRMEDGLFTLGSPPGVRAAGAPSVLLSWIHFYSGSTSTRRPTARRRAARPRARAARRRSPVVRQLTIAGRSEKPLGSMPPVAKHQRRRVRAAPGSAGSARRAPPPRRRRAGGSGSRRRTRRPEPSARAAPSARRCRPSSAARSQQRVTSSATPSRPRCTSAAHVAAPRHGLLASTPSSCRSAPAPGARVRYAALPANVSWWSSRVAQEGEADPVREVQPLVAVDGDRVGQLDPVHERRRSLAEPEEGAEGGVDVEPQALAGAEVRDLAQRVRRARVRGGRVRDHDRGDAAAARSAAIAVRQAGDVQAELVVDGDAAEAVLAQPERSQRLHVVKWSSVLP